MKQKFILCILILAALTILTGCDTNENEEPTDTIRVHSQLNFPAPNPRWSTSDELPPAWWGGLSDSLRNISPEDLGVEFFVETVGFGQRIAARRIPDTPFGIESEEDISVTMYWATQKFITLAAEGKLDYAPFLVAGAPDRIGMGIAEIRDELAENGLLDDFIRATHMHAMVAAWLVHSDEQREMETNLFYADKMRLERESEWIAYIRSSDWDNDANNRRLYDLEQAMEASGANGRLATLGLAMDFTGVIPAVVLSDMNTIDLRCEATRAAYMRGEIERHGVNCEASLAVFVEILDMVQDAGFPATYIGGLGGSPISGLRVDLHRIAVERGYVNWFIDQATAPRRVYTPPPCISTLYPDSPINFALAARLFAEANAIWDADDGYLWGVPLHTPLVVACSLTRTAAACRQLSDRFSRYAVGDMYVYAGVLPTGVFVSHTTARIGGYNTGMLMWFDPHNPWHDTACLAEADMLRILLHEAFHVVQHRIHGHSGMSLITGGGSASAQTRYILELTALLAAWNSTDEERLMHINNALYFRRARRQNNGTRYENQAEIGEGLVTYTADFILFRSREDFGYYIAQRIYDLKTFDRMITDTCTAGSWAYISGALYGILLDEFCAVWRTGSINRDTNLGGLLREAAGIDIAEIVPPEDPEIYGYSKISALSHARVAYFEAQIETAIAALQAPQIRLDIRPGYGREVDWIFIVPNRFAAEAGLSFDRDPFMVTSGTIICQWGRLDLENGHAQWIWNSGYRLSAPSFEIAGNRIYGQGWTITLNDGWIFSQSPGGGGLVRRG